MIALFATAVLNGEFKTTVSESGKVAKDPIFGTLFGSYDSGVPTAGVILLGLVVFFHWLTTRTKFGRYVFAVGGNAEAARRAGINIKLIRIAVFSLCGSWRRSRA